MREYAITTITVILICRKKKNKLKYSPGDKSFKALFIISADLECLLKKEQPCQNNPKNSYTQRTPKHKPSGYSLSLISSFDRTKNRNKFYRRKDSIKRYCNDLKELAPEIINYEVKEMISLTNEEVTFYESQKVCHICKEGLCYDKNKKKKFKICHKVREQCHHTGKFRGAAHNISNLRHKVPEENFRSIS